MYASYLSESWGTWAQYDRAQAGFYRDNVKKADRRRREIAAYKAGVSQLPRRLDHSIQTLRDAAAA